jgi:ribosomal-protein-alanine N-acetyltransferase
MRTEDIDAVYTMEKELFPNPWPKVFFETDLQIDGTIAYVVEVSTKIIGYSIASCSEGKFHITNIAVDQLHQRKGIASKLMHLLERCAIEKRCNYAYLEVRTDNKAAIGLYNGLGYRIAYRRNHYYIDGDDAYVMEKELE